MAFLEKDDLNTNENYYNGKSYNYDKRYEGIPIVKKDRKKYLKVINIIIILIIIIMLIIKGLSLAGCYIIKNKEYNDVSLDNMFKSEYGKDWGGWKCSLNKGNTLTTYKTSDGGVKIEFIGGIINNLELGDMNIYGKKLNIDEKSKYLFELSEKYKKKHGINNEIEDKDTDNKQNTNNNENSIEEQEDDTSYSEEENEVYKYSIDENLPSGSLSYNYDDSDKVIRLAHSLFIGSNEEIKDIYQYDGIIKEGESYDNGYFMYISSENEMGNYTFTIFCDTDNGVYYVESVKDKDNGKVFNSNKYINIYLEDVLNRYYGYV